MATSGFLEIEEGTAPGTPSANLNRIYVDSTDNKPKMKDDSGAVTEMAFDINGKTLETVADNVDTVPFYDVSAAAIKKIRICDLVTPSQDRIIRQYSDFLEANPDDSGFNTANTGTGASVQMTTVGVDATEKCLGVMECDTGTTATGRATASLDLASIIFGFAEFDLTWRSRVETLSTVTDTFTARLGFIDSSGAGECVDALMFRYSDAGSTPNWFAVARNNNVETSVNTGVAATTNFSRFNIKLNEAGTSATFFIDDILVATITTNIPSGAGRWVGVGMKIEKSAGTSVRDIQSDYYDLSVKFSAAR